MSVVLLAFGNQSHICLKLVNWFKNSQELTDTLSRRRKRVAFRNIDPGFISCYLIEEAREFNSKSEFLSRLLINIDLCNF